MDAGLRGHAGDNAREVAGRDYRPERGPVQTLDLAMAAKNAQDLTYSIRIAFCKGVQVKMSTSTLKYLKGGTVRLF